MESQQFPVTADWKKNALINSAQYDELYKASISDPENFWAKQAERIHWLKPWKKVSRWSFQQPVSVQWYTDGKLNVSQNCIDRHASKTPDRVAIIWEPESLQEDPIKITYKELQEHVSRWANLMQSKGVKKGDRVTIYLPMIPEAAYSMLACARIGAIHSVVFAGFSPNALADRINDCDSEYLITADEAWRNGKTIALKDNADRAAEKCPVLKHMFVVRRTGHAVNFQEGRDLWVNDELPKFDTLCEPAVMDAEDPLFILYTSGSTGKPKGVLHTCGGYLVYAAFTHETIFNYTAEQTYWCAADVGWVTGHSYIIYGPLANGATTVMFEGAPTFPDCSRLWQIVDKHQVNILYTAPTLIRALMRDGEAPVKKTSRRSLKVLGSVGEPINPEAWLWYYKVAGGSRCPIVDTWWQTETGGILIAPLPGATNLKPGSATLPFFGIEPVLMDDQGNELAGTAAGFLCIKRSWPGQMRSLYKDHERFENTYFSRYPGYYYTGDACRRDEDGYLWITGRVDDVLNVSGHRLGTAEIESALVSHKAVSEAAVVGFPHDIKGQGIYAYVTLTTGIEPSDGLRKDLVQHVRHEIGPLATPELIHWAPNLPKTRSGKIMRRILRKIAENDFSNLGDVSTLADPAVVDQLITGRLHK